MKTQKFIFPAKKSLTIFFLVVSSLSVAQSRSEKPYPRELERQKMLQLLEQVKQDTDELKISDFGYRSFPEQDFLNHFRLELNPKFFEISKLNSISSILSVAVDRALFNDEAEKEAWLNESTEATIKADAIRTSPEYKQALQRSAAYAQDWPGDLPEMIRHAYEIDRLTGFNSEQMPMIERIANLSKSVTTKMNESKVTGNDLAEFAKTNEQIEKDYRAGRISFGEATKRLDSIWSKGHHAKGHDVVQSAGSELNEIAHLRTQLAKSKGFNNWADFKLASEKFNHAKGFQTAEDHIRFFTNVLEKTLPAHLQYRQLLQKQNPGIPSAQIDNRNMHLLAPENDTLIAEYFPVENVDQFWRQTMIESGFSESTLESITLDSFPRAKKQTHAYMWPVVMTEPKSVELAKGSLNFVRPGVGGWSPAAIYIVQNARSDGYDAYTTVFHEGGHGLDFATRADFAIIGESYAYTETASMTMERFFQDKEFLLVKGRTRDGRSIAENKVDAFLKNSALLEAIGTRGQIFNALFDILLWREAYTDTSQQFVDRALRIYDELQTKYFPGAKTFPAGVRAGSRACSTSHFISGEVRYYGYIYANIAAQMTAEHLWDYFQGKTGRRTFLRQPELARLLIDGHYRSGFTKPFPLATEQMLGRPFDASVLVEKINGAVGAAKNDSTDCDELLR